MAISRTNRLLSYGLYCALVLTLLAAIVVVAKTGLEIWDQDAGYWGLGGGGTRAPQ